MLKNTVPKSSTVVIIIVEVEDGEICSREIVLRKRGAMTQNSNELLDKIPICYRSYDLQRYLLLFSNKQAEWYQEILI